MPALCFSSREGDSFATRFDATAEGIERIGMVYDAAAKSRDSGWRPK